MASTDRTRRPQKPRSDRPLVRRALSHVGGEVEVEAVDDEAHKALESLLKHALDVSPDTALVRAHVHGFHSYPGKLHPQTARRVIDGLSKPGDAVLDPFCGSGTVVVEARLSSRRAVGVDLNPLAVSLTDFKSRTTTPEERSAWQRVAAEVIEAARARKEQRLGPSRRYNDRERQQYDIHMLLELDSLAAALAEHRDAASQKMLKLVLSSITTKVSRSPGDSRDGVAPRRLAQGFALRCFARRVDEVMRQAEEFSKHCESSDSDDKPKGGWTQVLEGDARRLGLGDKLVNLVVSSPPYPGVFDYLHHHQGRFGWLGMDGKRFAQNEIGSRRQQSALDPSAALKRWRQDLDRCMKEIHRVLVPGGHAALILADSAVGEQPLFADLLVRELGEAAGLEWRATGSQRRPHFHPRSERAFGKRPRREHLVVLQRPLTAPSRSERQSQRPKAERDTRRPPRRG
jgi:DNA modification methylase